MSFDGLFTFYYKICDGMINFEHIKDQSIKKVTENSFKKYKDYIRMNNYQSKCEIMIGSNVSIRDCEFHKMTHDFSLSKTKTIKDSTIKFSDIQNKTKIMHLSTDFLYLRLDSSDDHIMKPYKRFISIIQPKFVLLNYEQNKVPITSCDPEIKYYVEAVDGYKIIDKGACKNGQYYDILTKYMNYDGKTKFECYYVEYVLLLERII
jgi:hypothetical protein